MKAILAINWTRCFIVEAAFAIILCTPAFAQECPAGSRTIADDKLAVDHAGGIEYLGIKRVPWTDGGLAVYYRKGDLTFLSIVVGGCVIDQALPVGQFKAEQDV